MAPALKRCRFKGALAGFAIAAGCWLVVSCSHASSLSRILGILMLEECVCVFFSSGRYLGFRVCGKGCFTSFVGPLLHPCYGETGAETHGVLQSNFAGASSQEQQ